MKKSLLTIAFLSASVAALAAVTSNVELCRIAVRSGTASTIISLPLEAVGGSDIMIKNIVLTDNLTAGDTLFATIDDIMYGWQLNANKEWEGTSVTEGSVTTQAGSDQTLARGTAIWVNRTANLNEPFYLYGQVGKTAVKNPTIKGGDATTHTYTMIGNPNPADIDDINTIAWQNPQLGDQIVWGSATAGLGVNLYSYRTIADGATKDAWGYYDVVKDETSGRNKIVWKTENIKLPAGQGFWYITKSRGERGITWTSETTAEQ